MIKSILVPVNGVAKDKAALNAALAAARLFDAHIDCLRVRLGPAALIWEGELVDVAAGVLQRKVIKTLEARARERSEKAHATFRKFCERQKIAVTENPSAAGVSAAWHEVTGSQVELLIANARLHDLVVAERDLLHDTDPAADLIGNLVLRSGRPVLLAAGETPKDFAKTVAIAWKNTPEAARAITAAMPFLEKAKKVVLLSADEGDAASDIAAPSAEALATTLNWHGLKTEIHVLDPGGKIPARAVVARARKAGAGLLVMGGYGHHRARELVFGGFTQDVIDSCSMPVLLFH